MPKTTAHPEKNIEYVRVIPRIAKAKLEQWKQYPGSDNNKAMMALITILQLYGLYVSDDSDNDDLPSLPLMSLWQYFRMAKGHGLYVLREQDPLNLQHDRMTNPTRILDELFYRYDRDYFIDPTAEDEEAPTERVVKRRAKR